MLKVLIDTNVVISGIFFRGNERKVLLHLIEGDFRGVIPQLVAEESLAVLERKFKGHPEMEDALELLFSILGSGQVASRDDYRGYYEEACAIIRDEKDAPILACALYSNVDLIVTGDRDFHSISRGIGPRVITPRAFLKLLEP